MRFRIFISSVQSEFAKERRELKEYLLSDPLLRDYVESVFIFEDQPATQHCPPKVYLPRVGDSDVYIGILGRQYGNNVARGAVSPTESEYDAASRAGLTQWMFFYDKPGRLDPRMKAFRAKVGTDHTWRKVTSSIELLRGVYAAFIDFLRERNLLTHEPFDAAIVQDATMDDIDRDRVRWFVDTAIRERKLARAVCSTDEKLLIHLKLQSKKTAALSRAAIMLFGKDPQSVCLSAKIKCVCCAGTQYRRPFVMQVYEGDLFDQVDQAEIFVLSHIDTTVGTRTDSTQAHVEYEVPPRAIREVIVNAVAHRDYASNASVEVRVFSDRIEVWNPGELPPGKTIEWLFGDHDSMPFNPLIAQAMYQVRYVEHVGSGIEDIEAACAEAGLPRTTIVVRNRTVIHTIWRKPTKENVSATKETTKERVATTKERGKATQEDAAAAKEIPAELLRGLEVLSDAARAIFQLFWEHRELTAETAAKSLGLTPNGVRYHIKRLKKDGLMYHEGPTKKGVWQFGPKPDKKGGGK